MPEFKDQRLQIEQGFISYANSTISGSLILTTGSLVFPDLTSQSTAPVGGGSGTPGGSSGQIQYNNGGNFGGVPTLIYTAGLLKATGSFSGSLTGTGSWAVSASQTVSSSYSDTSQATQTIAINSFGSNVESYILMSNVVATPGVAIGGDADLRYNASTNRLSVGSILATSLTGSFTGSFTGSLLGTSSWATSASQAVSSSFASSIGVLNQSVIITGSINITGSVNITDNLTASIVSSTSNGAGTNFRVGDDAWIGDINAADTLQVRGQQNGGRGYIKFGTGSSNPIIGSSGTSVLEIQNGYIQMPSRPAFRVTGSSGTNITAVTTLTSTQTGIDYNQGNYYTASSGIFIAPISGLYNVFMNIRVGNNNAQNQAIMYKNDTTSMLMWETSTNTGAIHFGVSGVIYLATNDNLRVKVSVGTIQFDANDSWGATYIG